MEGEGTELSLQRPCSHFCLESEFDRSSRLSCRQAEPPVKECLHGDSRFGAFTDGQIGYHRPFPGAGHYRGHLPGLYLCGSCCHPGGNITGLAGYNSAQVILADLGLPAEWASIPAEECLDRL